MAANATLPNSSSLEYCRMVAELTTLPLRTELSDPLPRHLSDSNIKDRQKEYAARHKTKVQTLTSVEGQGRTEVRFGEKFENEPSEKEINSTTQQILQDTRITPPNIDASVAPSQHNCSGNTHCTEPLITVGHQLMANIRTVWSKLWYLSSDDALASG